MAAGQGLLEISSEPNPFLHVFTAKEVLALLNELISTHLHVLIEQVAAKHLLSVPVVQHVRCQEQETKSHLSDELHVLVVKEDVVVVEEEALS